jgi:hypothetical protein
MASALKKATVQEDAVQLDVKELFSAAIQRAEKVHGTYPCLLDMISKTDWETMDATKDNILVFDPE